MKEPEAIYDETLGWHREGDLPIKPLLAFMHRVIESGQIVWVKFTCQNCHARQTSAEPNCFHVHGYTCEECGVTTKPKVYGAMMLGLLEQE